MILKFIFLRLHNLNKHHLIKTSHNYNNDTTICQYHSSVILCRFWFTVFAGSCDVKLPYPDVIHIIWNQLDKKTHCHYNNMAREAQSKGTTDYSDLCQFNNPSDIMGNTIKMINRIKSETMKGATLRNISASLICAALTLITNIFIGIGWVIRPSSTCQVKQRA